MDAKRKKILDDAAARSAWDPAYFCRFFLRKWFPRKQPPFHLGILAIVTRKVKFLDEYEYAHDFLLNNFFYEGHPDDPTSTRVNVFYLGEDGSIHMRVDDNAVLMIPRGFSKTTLLNAANLSQICTDGTTFTVYVSETIGHAETQLSNIRAELEENELLREAFGNFVPKRSDTLRWNDEWLQLTNGACLVARGRGGQIRGLNFRGRRPNRILLDDVEDEDSVKSDTVREATTNWMYSAVLPAGNQMEFDDDSDISEDEDYQEPLQVTCLGTLLGAQCLLMTLARDPTFNVVRFGARIAPGHMLWQAKMSEPTYERKRNQWMAVGKLSSFTREYDSLISTGDESKFPQKFSYTFVARSQLVAVAIALDPAISDRPGADHAALVAVGRRADNGALVVLDEWGGQGKTPTEKVDAVFDMWAKWQATHVGIEAVQYQAALLHIMRDEMARRRVFFHIEPIRPGKKDEKNGRIVGMLSPRYSNGYISHLRPLPGYEGNLLDWPNGKKDYADAATMACKLLGESAGMLIPKELRDAPEHPPMEDALPFPGQSISGYYIPQAQASALTAQLNTRYPR